MLWTESDPVIGTADPNGKESGDPQDPIADSKYLFLSWILLLVVQGGQSRTLSRFFCLVLITLQIAVNQLILCPYQPK